MTFKTGDLVTWSTGLGMGDSHYLGLVLSYVDDFGALKCVVRFIWITDGLLCSYTGKYYTDSLKFYGT